MQLEDELAQIRLELAQLAQRIAKLQSSVEAEAEHAQDDIRAIMMQVERLKRRHDGLHLP
jgi:hypothetical protein